MHGKDQRHKEPPFEHNNETNAMFNMSHAQDFKCEIPYHVTRCEIPWHNNEHNKEKLGKHKMSAEATNT